MKAAGACRAWLPLMVGLSVSHTSHAATCEDLTTTGIPGLTVRAATIVQPDPLFVVLERPGETPDVTVSKPFCRVEGFIDRTIGFELWLPDDWNGKFFSAGVGGYAGSIGVWGMAPALERGYAVSSTDTGHQGSGAEFMQDREALENYAYRAVHRTAETAKSAIENYYGKAPAYSYFSGCSGGGYAGLANVQRYPGDYDGVISGAPGTEFIHHAARAMWVSQLNRPGSPGHIPSSKDRLIPDAVTAACDAEDGVTDGLIGNPLSCDFELASLACPSGSDDNTCLTPAQLETASKLYGPMLNDDGERVYPATAIGTPLPAEALATRGRFYAAFWKTAVFEDPDWDPETFAVADVARADAKLGKYLYAGNPDLAAFRERGGKLILYHGWYDAGVSPLNTIAYYEEVEARDGDVEARAYARLFLVPGMAHCAGGIGPDRFDTLTALEAWVEKGEAPEELIASQFDDGEPIRTRPLCPYPEVAVYEGLGSTDEAGNFACRNPR